MPEPPREDQFAAAGRALLSGGSMAKWLTPTAESRIERIAVRDVADRPWPPADDSDTEALDALRHSIAGHGIVEPLLLRRAQRGFEVVSGSRRLSIARALGLTHVPAIVRDIDAGSALVAVLSATAGRRLIGTSEFDEVVRQLAEYGIDPAEATALVGAAQPQTTSEFLVRSAPSLNRSSRFRQLLDARAARPRYIVSSPPRARDVGPDANAALVGALLQVDPATVLHPDL